MKLICIDKQKRHRKKPKSTADLSLEYSNISEYIYMLYISIDQCTSINTVCSVLDFFYF